MISNPSDYLFVTIPVSIQINDEVMPERYANAAKRRVLRGLDAAMMLECVGERDAVVGAVKHFPLGREVSGAPFRDASKWCHEHSGAGSIWREKDSQIPQVIPASAASTLEERWGTPINDGNLESAQGDFAVGKPLLAESLMKLYRDMNKFRCFCPETRSAIGVSGYSFQRGYESSNGRDYTDERINAMDVGGQSYDSSRVYYHEAANWDDTAFESRGSTSVTATMQYGGFVARPPRGAMLNLYGQVWPYVLIKTTLDWSGTSTTYDFARVATRIPEEGEEGISDGFEIDASSVVGAAAAVRAANGIVPIGIADLPRQGGQYIDQRAVALALAVELTDHTDFSQWIGEGEEF